MCKKIIKKFINKFKNNHPNENITVVGILGFGSNFNQRKISKNSDLDLYIIIKNTNKRYRGIMIVDGMEIDYFVNPIKQLEQDWKNFKKGIMHKNTILYMLKDSKIILDKNNQLKKIKAEAKIFFKEKIENKKILLNDLIIKKYFIEDYLKDIEDDLENKDIQSWQYNFNLLLIFLVEFFCEINKIPLDKPKYLMEEIAKKDKKFIKIYNSIAKSLSIKDKSQKINELSLYCLNLSGSKLPKEWEIKNKTCI